MGIDSRKGPKCPPPSYENLALKDLFVEISYVKSLRRSRNIASSYCSIPQTYLLARRSSTSVAGRYTAAPHKHVCQAMALFQCFFRQHCSDDWPTQPRKTSIKKKEVWDSQDTKKIGACMRIPQCEGYKNVLHRSRSKVPIKRQVTVQAPLL